MSARKSSHRTIFLIVSSGSPLALIASSLRSTSKKPVCPMTRALHPPMAHCRQRVRFAATWREEFFEVPRNIWPDSCVFRIQRQPFLKPGFAISLDSIDGAFRFANATVDAFVRMDDEHVLALVEAVHGAHLDAVHGFAANAAIVDDVGQLGPSRRLQRSTHVRDRCARSLAENGRTEDLRPLAQSEHRAVGIQGPRSSRLLGCSASLH